MILFIDSDVEIAPDFLRRLSETARDRPNDVVFQARLRGGEASLVERMEGLRLSAIQEVLSLPSGYIRYANTSALAVRRSFISTDCELFDVRAVRGEDTLLLRELAARAQLPLFVSKCEALHRPRVTLWPFIVKHFRIGYYTSFARGLVEDTGDFILTASGRGAVFRQLWRKAGFGVMNRIACVLVVLAYGLELCGRGAYRVLGMHPAGRRSSPSRQILSESRNSLSG